MRGYKGMTLEDKKPVFVSHATVDKPIVDELVNLMSMGMKVPPDHIYQSSHPGRGTPPGDDLIKTVRKHLGSAKVVILMLTPNYFNSVYCLGEMGATWFLGRRKTFPLILPDMKPETIAGFLRTRDMGRIDDGDRLNLLYSVVSRSLALPQNVVDWDQERARFLRNLRNVLIQVPGPTSVPGEDHENVKAQRDNALMEKEELRSKLAEKDKIIQQILAAKSLDEANRLATKSTENSDAEYAAFKAIIARLRQELGSLPSTVVDVLHADYCGKDYPENGSIMAIQEVVRFEQHFRSLIHQGYLNESSYRVRPNYDHFSLKPIRADVQELRKLLLNASKKLKITMREKYGFEFDLKERQTWQFLRGAEFFDI